MKKLILSVLVCLTSISAWATQPPVITFVAPGIVRVQWAADGKPVSNETGVCVYAPQAVKSSVKQKGDNTVYRSAELEVSVDNTTGAITFLDRRTRKVLLCEDALMPRTVESVVSESVVYDEASARTVETANGQVTIKDVLRRDTLGVSLRFQCRFQLPGDEALYGLGAHMEDFMNLRGKTQYLCQHNLKTMVPMLQSTAGYGLLFDAGCAMIYSDSLQADGTSRMTLQMEAAKAVDYYFMKGETMDDVVAQYHYLTGNVPLMPRYLTGYVQSRERYRSQDELVGVLREFRQRHIPIDMIVQDWNYWPQGWGYAKMAPRYYPDPKAMADSVHAMNARLMISVWPNPQNCPEQDFFRKAGLLLEHSSYDAYSPKGRDMYWDIINAEFFSKGFDAWWCDCSEPVDGDWKPMREGYGWDNHRERWELNTKALTEVGGPLRSQLYSLYHAQGIYEHQRATTDQKRVVNLTRSGYAGQQRYATINWNGDTHASWPSFKRMIPAGLNYIATGNPYWTVDAGCFFTRNDGRWFWSGQYPNGNSDPAYREFYTRMLQWTAFLPVMRSHGTDTLREPWFFGQKGEPYYDAILDAINLRYRLTPYIYSMEAHQSLHDYTMTRLLAFDFPGDVKARDIKDEYMFGSILACPVTDPGVTSRQVYLPQSPAQKGKNDARGWIDFWTGKTYDGGQTVEADAPLNRLPLFVRQGSIVPTTVEAEYTGQQTDKPVTLNVFPGTDASFTLYDDEGDNYNYEKGQYATIELQWNDARRTLTIGARQGSYPGMPAERTFIVKTPWGEQTVTYLGKALKVRMPHLDKM